MAQPTSTRFEEDAKAIRVFDAIPCWRHVGGKYLLNGASDDMAVDGSGGSPQTFSYTPPAGYDFVANRLMLFIECSSAMSTAVFGNLAAALGIGIEIKAAAVLMATWKDNIDIYTQMFDVDTLANVSNATPDTTLNGRWTFTNDMNGAGILVPNGDSFDVIINDDLSTITILRMRVKGKLVATGM